MRIVRILDATEEAEWPNGQIMDDNDDFIVIDLGENVVFQNADGCTLVQKDYKVDGVFGRSTRLMQIHFLPDPTRIASVVRHDMLGTSCTSEQRSFSQGLSPWTSSFPKSPSPN